MNMCEMQRQATIHGRIPPILLLFFYCIASLGSNAIYTPLDLLSVTITLCREHKLITTIVRAANPAPTMP